METIDNLKNNILAIAAQCENEVMNELFAAFEAVLKKVYLAKFSGNTEVTVDVRGIPEFVVNTQLIPALNSLGYSASKDVNSPTDVKVTGVLAVPSAIDTIKYLRVQQTQAQVKQEPTPEQPAITTADAKVVQMTPIVDGENSAISQLTSGTLSSNGQDHSQDQPSGN